MTFSPSGQQLELSVDDQHVTIVEVGGGIRSYRVGDRDVLRPYAMDQMCDGAPGAPLIPRPNRLTGPSKYCPAIAACRAGPRRPRPTGTSPAKRFRRQPIASFDQRIQ